MCSSHASFTTCCPVFKVGYVLLARSENDVPATFRQACEKLRDQCFSTGLGCQTSENLQDGPPDVSDASFTQTVPSRLLSAIHNMYTRAATACGKLGLLVALVRKFIFQRCFKLPEPRSGKPSQQIAD